MMVRFWLFTGIFITLAGYTLSFDYSRIIVFPRDGSLAGVFMVSYGSPGLNASQARDMCLFLNATIATRAQVQTALQHRLETCKWGWIDEEILVIPRIEKSTKCGNNQAGVVPWKANIRKPSNAFCFKSADLEEPLGTTPADVQAPGMSTTTTTRTTTVSTSSHTTTVTHLFKSTPKVPVFIKSTIRVWKTVPATTVPGPLKSTLSSSMSTSTSTSTSTPSPGSSLSTISPSLSTSSHSLSRSVSPTSSSPSSVFASSLHLPLSSLTVASESVISNLTVESQPVSSAGSSIGAIPTAFLVLFTILLLLAVAAAVWYLKMNRRIFPWLSGKYQKKDVETEMWRASDSETDLHEHQREGEGEEEEEEEEEEEDSDRKYSSDITLCVNPDMKTNSS